MLEELGDQVPFVMLNRHLRHPRFETVVKDLLYLQADKKSEEGREGSETNCHLQRYTHPQWSITFSQLPPPKVSDENSNSINSWEPDIQHRILREGSRDSIAKHKVE